MQGQDANPSIRGPAPREPFVPQFHRHQNDERNIQPIPDVVVDIPAVRGDDVAVQNVQQPDNVDRPHVEPELDNQVLPVHQDDEQNQQPNQMVRDDNHMVRNDANGIHIHLHWDPRRIPRAAERRQRQNALGQFVPQYPVQYVQVMLQHGWNNNPQQPLYGYMPVAMVPHPEWCQCYQCNNQ